MINETGLVGATVGQGFWGTGVLNPSLIQFNQVVAENQGAYHGDETDELRQWQFLGSVAKYDLLG